MPWRASRAAGGVLLASAILCCAPCWCIAEDDGRGHRLRALAIPVSLEERDSATAPTASCAVENGRELIADLVVLEESASVNASVADQVLTSVDPVWLRLGLPKNSFLTWSGCGGWFRPHWRLLASDVPETQREEMEHIFHESNTHIRCGGSLLMYRLGDGHRLPSHPGTSAVELGRRIATSIGALTSSRYPWTESTPLHERPVGVVAAVSNGSVAHLVAEHDTLCTQHLVQLLNPTHSGRSCDHVFSSLLPSIPFLLSTRWHQFVLSVTHNRNGLLTVTRRLSFVVANHEEEAWWSHVTQSGAVSGGERSRRRRTPSESISTEASLTSESPWRVLQEVQHSGDRNGVFSVRVCRAIRPGAATQTSSVTQGGQRGTVGNVLRTRLLVWLPASWIKPILHRVSTNTSGASPSGTASMIGYHYDRDLATALLYFAVRFSESSVVDVGGVESSQCVHVQIPYETVFTPLSARPPDAHKRYLLPQSMLQVPVVCSSGAKSEAPPQFSQEEREARAEMLQQLFALPSDGPRRSSTRCYRYYRAQPTASSISLPVPDGAMVFNVVSIGMLPFAAMLGAVLRRTGRRTT